jgi:hypothetical protein
MKQEFFSIGSAVTVHSIEEGNSLYRGRIRDIVDDFYTVELIDLHKQKAVQRFNLRLGWSPSITR